MLSLNEKTLPYNFRIIYVKGGSLAIRTADCMSRYAIESDESDPDFDEIEQTARAHATFKTESSVSWQQINEAAATDNECVSLVMFISVGFPDKREDLPEVLRKFWPMRGELYVIDNVPFKGNKMLIPTSLRSTVLEKLHVGHQGVTGMLAYARSRFFWPGMGADVQQ